MTETQYNTLLERARNIPLELIDRAHWLVWRYRSNRKGEKPKKKPYDAKTGNSASTSDPSTWGDFDTVLKAARSYDGIGFVFTEADPFTAIDWDIDKETGKLDPLAYEITIAFGSYAEFSPNMGIRQILKGKLPFGVRSRKLLQMYDSHQYLTITGNHISGTLLTIEERQSQLNELDARFFPHKPQTEKCKSDHIGNIYRPSSKKSDFDLNDDDLKLLDAMRKAENGEKFVALYDRGDWATRHGSQNQADLALCNMLDFWMRGDAPRIDKFFRRSKLYREKWHADIKPKNTTYGGWTITKAIHLNKQHYEVSKAERAAAQLRHQINHALELDAENKLWKKKAGSTRKVLLYGHILLKGYRAEYSASVRQIAETAGISTMTASKGTRALQAAGWIQRLRRGYGSRGSLYVLTIPKHLHDALKQATHGCIIHSPSSGTPPPHREDKECAKFRARVAYAWARDKPPSEATLDSPACDAWRYGGGLGKRKYETWTSLDTAITQTAKALAAKFVIKVSTMRGHLNTLKKYKLAAYVDGGWKKLYRDAEELAEELDIRGKGQRERAYHDEEREIYRHSLEEGAGKENEIYRKPIRRGRRKSNKAWQDDFERKYGKVGQDQKAA